MAMLSLIQLFSFFTILFVWSHIWASPGGNTPVKRALLFFAFLDIPFLGFELLTLVPLFKSWVGVFFQMMMPFWMLLGFGFLNFAYRWTERRNDLMYYAVLALSLLAMLYFVVSGKVYLGHRFTPQGVVDIRNELLHALVAVPSIAGGIIGIYLLWLSRRRESAETPRRIQDVILFGAVITLSAIVVSDVVLPDFFNVSHFTRLGSSMFVVFILLVFFAVRKYRFLHFGIDEVAVPFFENINDAVIWVVDGARVHQMNPAAREWFGVGKAEEGVPITTYLPFPEKQRLRLELGGQVRWVRNTSYSIRKNNLEMMRVFVLRDETEVHHAREVLRTARNELEKEATTRSERLLQAQRLEALASLSGSIAHEFNNLLTTVMGYSTAALDDVTEGDPVREDLLEVLNAAERARDIVKQMLTFSDAGNREQMVLDVVGLVREALKLVNISIPGNVTVTFEFEENLFTRGNATRLHQAVINLLTNAIHAMDQGGGELRVRLCQSVETTPIQCINASLPPGEYVRVAIGDTGCGIPPGHIGKIFEPFFTTRKQGKGTGIGLATVFRVMAESSGGILVNSTVGEGTIFELLFSRAEQGQPQSARTPAETSQKEQTGTILVVDDNNLVINVIRRILEPLGYRVISFGHPVSVLDALKENRRMCDLALLDYRLPMMNGLALAERIQQMSNDLPIILFSGKMTDSLESEAKAQGIARCLSKPLSKQQLVSVVMDLLAKEGGNGRT